MPRTPGLRTSSVVLEEPRVRSRPPPSQTVGHQLPPAAGPGPQAEHRSGTPAVSDLQTLHRGAGNRAGDAGTALASELGVLCVTRDTQLPQTMVPDLQGQGDQGPEACVRPRGSGRPGDGHTGNADSAPLPQDAAAGSRPGLSAEVAGTARGGAPGEVWRVTAARPVKEPLQRAESAFGSRFGLRHRCASGRQDGALGRAPARAPRSWGSVRSSRCPAVPCPTASHERKEGHVAK